jgi:hypothetical protein
MTRTVGACRFIWEILLSPHNLTARLIPMYPVIQVIPTFGIYVGVISVIRRTETLMTPNIPMIGMTRMDGLGRTVPEVSPVGIAWRNDGRPHVPADR